MPAPRRWRNIAAVLAAAGIAALLAGIFAPDASISEDARIGAVVAGGVLSLLCAIWAVVKHREVRQRERLARGEDVIARWRVDPDTWQRFADLDATLREEQDAVAEHEPPGAAPSGVEVVVGRDAVQVGDALHRVPEHGNPEVQWARLDDGRLRLAFVELSLLHHPARVGDPPTQTLLRFPVADGSLAAARAVVAHFARETPQRPSFFHGPGDGSDPEDHARCWKCGYETFTLRSYCPRCGATMQSRRWARRFGGVLVLLGGGIAVVMGWLLAWAWKPLTRPGLNFGGTRFTGTESEAAIVLGILASVAAFGAATFGYGMFQLVTGRRSWRAVQVMLGLVGAALVLAFLLR